ncbi:MAG: hypothetical protein LBL45_01475 [Treponema sp.]|jgi:hypothetical protein|nr:hypothetical protein [Treponema sp.]
MDNENYGVFTDEINAQTQRVKQAEDRLKVEVRKLSTIESQSTANASMTERVNVERKILAQKQLVAQTRRDLASTETELQNKISRAKAELEAEAHRIKVDAFKKAGFELNSPTVRLFSEVYGNLLGKEDFDKLRFAVPMFFGLAPDGTYRVRQTAGKETANCYAFIIEKHHPAKHHQATGGGKVWVSDPYTPAYTEPAYTEYIWILSNGYFYATHAGFNRDNLDSWFFEWFMNDLPETDYERNNRIDPRPLPRGNIRQQQETIRTQQEDKRIKEQSDQWASQGLCPYCGGKRGTWSGKCKKCGRS